MENYDGEIETALDAAARAIESARYLTAFTGAGISVESGVPPFRGTGGLWSRYDPRVLELQYFLARPEECWPIIREIFYDHFAEASPNPAHLALAHLEQQERLKVLITQNIDNLHFMAGSRRVIEYHGNSRVLVCIECGKRHEVETVDLSRLPPRCASCNSILKPDFVFFGEGIPPRAAIESEQAARETDVMLLIGTTGEVYPAASLPRAASRNGAVIIEVNPAPSLYTEEISDIVVHLQAGKAMAAIEKRLTFA